MRAGTVDYQKIIDDLVSELATMNVEVVLTTDTSDETGIAELKYNKIVVNTTARTPFGVIVTIAHLFGHMIQFINYDKYKHLVEKVREPKPLTLDENFKNEYHNYEFEAFRLGKALIERVHNFDEEFERQYQNYERTDFEHFWHYITTGEKGEIKYFNEMLEANYHNWEGQEITPLVPLPIPETITFTEHTGQVD